MLYSVQSMHSCLGALGPHVPMLSPWLLNGSTASWQSQSGSGTIDMSLVSVSLMADVHFWPEVSCWLAAAAVQHSHLSGCLAFGRLLHSLTLHQLQQIGSASFSTYL